MNELVLINPTEYGLEETKANELIGNLPQIISERNELEKQFDEVIKLDIEDLETTTRARELRLLIQKNRTQGINVWHKTTKDFFLKGGQFVDAIKRKEVAVNERMENDLTQIEKHYEIKEQKRLEDLQAERVELLSPYVEDAHERQLSNMEDDVWNAYLSAKKKEYEDRIEAEKKAEQERIAKEKAEKEEQERIRKENELLKKEAEEKERLAKIEAEKREKTEKERLAKEAVERKKREEKERKEREAYEAKLKKEREERERIEREERAKREKLEAELKAKKEAEQKEKQRLLDEELAKKKAEKAARLAPDKDKLLQFAEKLSSLELPELKSNEAGEILKNIVTLIGKTTDYIKQKANEL